MTPGHFKLLMPLNQKAKKAAMMLAGVTDPDYKGKLDYYSKGR